MVISERDPWAMRGAINSMAKSPLRSGDLGRLEDAGLWARGTSAPRRSRSTVAALMIPGTVNQTNEE